MSERFYQNALSELLQKEKIPFEKELMAKINYQGKEIGRYFLDFVIDGKVVVELKVRSRLGYIHVKQVLEYLKSSNYKLALLIYFTNDGVKYRRIVNSY